MAADALATSYYYIRDPFSDHVWCIGPGVGVTKAPFVLFSVFDIAKIPIMFLNNFHIWR